MAKQPIALAKFTRPKLFGVIARERLFALLDDRRQYPVVWIAGPPGAGKTTCVATYLQARKLAGLWYQVDGGDADPASFFYYLGQAAQKLAAGKRKTLPLLTPEYLADLPGFSRRFFRELCGCLPPTAVLVLDNYQDVDAGSAFHEVIREAIPEIRDGLNLIVLSRADPPPQCARALANNLIGKIGWEELRLTLDETKAIAAIKQDLDQATAEALQAQSDGWAAGLVLMLERLKQTGAMHRISRTETMSAVFNYFAGQVFDQATPDTRDLLLRTAFLPSITIGAAEQLSGNTDAGKLLDRLYRRHLFTDRRIGEETSYQYHSLFRGFLVSRVNELYGPDQQRALKKQSANLLNQSGHTDDALLLHIDNADWEAAITLILQEARSLIAQGRWLTLKTWIGLVPKEQVATTPWLTLWLGSSLILINPPNARTLLARAFDQLAARSDELGQLLAAIGMVESYNIEFSSFSELDPWISILEGLLRKNIAFPSLATEMRAHAALMLATMLRQPDHAMLPGSARRVVAIMEQDISPASRADAATQLLQYYDFTGDLDAAIALVAKATPLLNRPELSPFRRAGWLVFTSYHSALAGTYQDGFEALDQARVLAQQYGLGWFGFFDLFFRALLHLMRGEPADAEALLEQLSSTMDPARPANAAQYHLARTMQYQAQGDTSLALHHGQLCVDAAKKTGGALFDILFPTVIATAFIEAGEHGKALALVHDAQVRSAGTAYHHYMALMLMVEAYSASRRNDAPEAHRLLRQALILGRDGNSAYFFRWMVVGFRRMLAEALRAGIETDYVRSLIRKFGVPAESPEIENWPWPIRIYSLGTFALVINGSPLEFKRKAQKKPLEMLKCLVAQGDREVNALVLGRALWPDAEDGAADSLDVTLRRLRKLLGNDEAVTLKDGKLALNARTCWVDTWAFERAQTQAEVLLGKHGTRTVASAEFEALSDKALQLYPGPFLPGDEEEPWLLGYRQRLASKFLRHVTATGQYWEDKGESGKAAILYQRALELDPLAESVYRQLMIVQGRQGRKAEALETYRRCRQMLSVVLSIKPSSETEAVHQSLTGN